jgi:aldehyde dehydrogenase (NAD+)
MNTLIDSQRVFFNSNATKSVAFRIHQLRALRSLLAENERELEAAIRADYGKGQFETFLTELYLIYDEIEVAMGKVEEWAGHQPVSTNLLNAPARSYIIPEPLGVSLVIGPWNYPYQLALAPVVAAIVAGCTVVLKPSELTVQSSALLSRLIRERFDPAFFAVVEGGIPETTALLAEKFDIIFFTGSVPVGKIVYQAAAKHLTPVVLELGGKSPTIIEPDCELDVAARRVVWAKFLNAGQTCIAPDYVCVHRSVERQFLDRLCQEIRTADYALRNDNYVRIVNERNTRRLVDLIDPSKVILGGKHDVASRFIEPTVMAGVTWEDAVMQEELFGPVLPVIAYDSLDELIALIKARAKPLSLYLFTESEATKKKVLGEVSFGGGCVNDAVMHITNGALPFGGVGDSGMGNYHGIAGFRAFSHYKSVLDRDAVADPDIKYSPHTDDKLALLKSVVGMSPTAVFSKEGVQS